MIIEFSAFEDNTLHTHNTMIECSISTFMLHINLTKFHLRILGTSSSLYKTSDGGITWTSISSGLPTTQSSYEFKFHAISVGTSASKFYSYLTENDIL